MPWLYGEVIDETDLASNLGLTVDNGDVLSATDVDALGVPNIALAGMEVYADLLNALESQL